MTKEIEEMNKAVRSLALELPEQVYNSFHAAWERFRFRMLTPITQPADVQERLDKEYPCDSNGDYSPVRFLERKAYLAGASSMQEENERLRKSLRQLVWNWDNDIWTDADIDEAREALNKQQ